MGRLWVSVDKPKVDPEADKANGGLRNRGVRRPGKGLLMPMAGWGRIMI